MRNVLTPLILILAIADCGAQPPAQRPGVGPRDAEQVRQWGLANGWQEVVPQATTRPQDEESAAEGGTASPEARGARYAFTAADRDRGFVLFAPDRNTLAWRDLPPLAWQVGSSAIQSLAFPGESEGLSVAIHALGDLDGVTVEVSDLKSATGGLIRAADVRVRELIYAPLSLRNRRESANRFQMWPMWLVPPKPEPIGAGQGRVFWLTVRCPADAARGVYTGTVTISARQTRAARGIAVDVQPFKLDGSLCSWAPVTAGNGFDLALYQQLAEHHMTGLSWWWGDFGLTVTREGDKASFDPAPMDYLNAVTREAGLRGPWIIFLGNMIRGHLECRIAGYYRDGIRPPLFDVKLVPITESKPGVRPDGRPSVADLADPEMSRRYVEVLGALAERAKLKGYPQIIVCPYDEPNKYLSRHNAHWADLIHRHVPELKVLNTPQGSTRYAENLMPYSDYMDLQGGNDRIYDLTVKAGKTPLGYSRLTANQGFAQARHDMGLRFAEQHPSVIYFWSLNYGTLDERTPFNDLFERDSGFRHRFAWAPARPGQPWVETLVWEAQREGAKDYLLLLMLRRELKTSKSPRADAIQAELADLARVAARQAGNADARRAKLIGWYRELTGK